MTPYSKQNHGLKSQNQKNLREIKAFKHKVTFIDDEDNDESREESKNDSGNYWGRGKFKKG